MTWEEIENYRQSITKATSEEALTAMRERLRLAFPDDHIAGSLVQCIDIRTNALHEPIHVNDNERVWTPLTPFQENEFLTEIHFQVGLAGTAYDSYRTGRLEENHAGTSLWSSVYGVMSAAARVSQIFYKKKYDDPEKGHAKRLHVGRALYLRQALGISEEDGIRSRAARNFLEHYDEELDRRVEPGMELHYDFDIPADNARDPEVLKRTTRALLDEDSVVVQGREYDLGSIMRSLQHLKPRLEIRARIAHEIIGRRLAPY
jgi:hypothetical protein